ncbi:MAG: hypothetical protein BWY91_01901 [bacterium ADurb.BinA028]|nr:MAG: hypothetical protein BWY91_01901 [bacterium ADurb.BinA028]
MRRLDHRAVAGDVGHRREHVEGLGARDTRHGVHGHRRDPRRREFVDQCRVEGRLGQAHEDRALAKQRDLLVGGWVDLGDDVGAPDGGRMGDRGAGCGIRGIIETCRGTRARFDSDLIPEFEKLFDGLGGGSDPGLTRPRLPRDTDEHVFSLRRRVSPQRERTTACRVDPAMSQTYGVGPEGTKGPRSVGEVSQPMGYAARSPSRPDHPAVHPAGRPGRAIRRAEAGGRAARPGSPRRRRRPRRECS